jgi:parvulin-like peptidyl-prolyl isomerase
MQTKKIFALLISIIISGSCLFAAVPFGKPAAIVKFNGQTKPISETELNNQVNNVVAMYKAQGQAIEASAVKKQVLDSMIDNLLLEAGAARDGVVISDAQVDQLVLQQKYMIEQQAGRSITDTEFNQIINQQVGSLQDYKEYIKSQALINQYLLVKKGSSLTQDKAIATESEIQSYYRANKSSLINPECVNIAQIFIPFKDNSTNNDNEKKLQTLADDLKTNKLKWEDAVKKYNQDVSTTSSDGDIGWLTQDDPQKIKTVLGQDYFNIAFDLNPGNISNVITSAQGYHIIKIKEHIDIKLLKLEDSISPADKTTVREYISQLLSSQKAQTLAANALVELSNDLRNQATISYLTK